MQIKLFRRERRQIRAKLTSLSPSLSTLQCKKAVCPIVTVMFLCTSKSKYGIKYEEAGSIVDEKLQDSEMKKEEFIPVNRILLRSK